MMANETDYKAPDGEAEEDDEEIDEAVILKKSCCL